MGFNIRYFLWPCLALGALLLAAPPAAAVDCTNPPAAPGTVIYNDTHDVFQGCIGDGTWVAFHGNPSGGGGPPGEACLTGAPGTDCGDGSFYIGTIGGNRIYAAAADETDMKEWGGYGTTVIPSPSTTDGRHNTYPFLNNSTYAAGYACAEKSPEGTWYLPSKDELNLIWTNRESIQLSAKGFDILGDYYWSSSERDTSSAWIQSFSDGDQSNGYDKATAYKVRCVRR